ncbi:MAG: hypothetical protein LBE48_03795 [Methanomassiliicoccaceae archaeon]|jgi:sporulation protein YlmC with PRC-barrel domain|nr:hypothetical protein [Methanomassiliicoccaceae archaeon]
MSIPLESLKDLEIISSDAYLIGEIIDVRYDPFEWKVIGLKVRSKKPHEKLAIGHGKAVFLIRPDDFVLNDVMLLGHPVDGLKDMIVPDNNNISSLSAMMSAKVVTRDNILVGTVNTVLIDPDNWKVLSIVVRLDKTAIEAMRMKKGLFEKINVEIRSDIILTASDMIHLDEQMDGVKAKMTVLE